VEARTRDQGARCHGHKEFGGQQLALNDH
jgi:hypothetical protein